MGKGNARSFACGFPGSEGLRLHTTGEEERYMGFCPRQKHALNDMLELTMRCGAFRPQKSIKTAMTILVLQSTHDSAQLFREQQYVTIATREKNSILPILL